MTPERAKELLHECNAEGYGALCGVQSKYPKETHEERQEVMALWDTMPGYTCYADALRRIANQKES